MLTVAHFPVFARQSTKYLVAAAAIGRANRLSGCLNNEYALRIGVNVGVLRIVGGCSARDARRGFLAALSSQSASLTHLLRSFCEN
jgi:hypothetical protein